MKTHHMLAIVFLLLVSSATLAQPSRATNAAANRSWQSFWRQITVAINKKDRVALRKMMPDNFSDGGGGLTPGEWLKFIDENERRGSWRDLKKSFAQGTVIHREWSAKGMPTRVTKDKGYYFEFRKDKRWYFAGVVGDRPPSRSGYCPLNRLKPYGLLALAYARASDTKKGRFIRSGRFECCES